VWCTLPALSLKDGCILWTAPGWVLNDDNNYMPIQYISGTPISDDLILADYQAAYYYSVTGFALLEAKVPVPATHQVSLNHLLKLSAQRLAVGWSPMAMVLASLETSRERPNDVPEPRLTIFCSVQVLAE
jgi:hypothetical protein